jgi:hypothetical protein
VSDDDILAALEADFGEIEEPEVHPVTEWTPLELMDSLESTEEALRAMGELLSVRTAEGRRLHSERGAIVVELRRRKLR